MQKDIFTKRELQVIRQLVDAKSNPEISEELNISVSTVKMHCKSIFKKMEVHNRNEAVLKAILMGIVML